MDNNNMDGVEKLNVLDMFKNTWYGNLQNGFGVFILLSADRDKEGKMLWECAFSYEKMGCKIIHLYEEEIHRCIPMGNIFALKSQADELAKVLEAFGDNSFYCKCGEFGEALTILPTMFVGEEMARTRYGIFP